MTTSLAQQLKKLSVPQSSIYKDQKKKASLLFDPKEAAALDRETFYEIGISGLNELKGINAAFALFDNSLFGASSKDFERAVHTKEANDRLNDTIDRFLVRLSPYFLLRPAHKALEWLVHRFHIHRYNQNSIFALILPYHETKMFVRFVQIMKLDERWSWLEPIKKPGIPLTKTVLFTHAVSTPSFLKFASDETKRAVEELGSNADSLNALFAFYCSTTVGAVVHPSTLTEPTVANVLPGLMEFLASPLADLRAAAMIITAQLCLKTQLRPKTIRHIVHKVITFKGELSNDAVLLLQIIFESQWGLDGVQEKSLRNLTVDLLDGLVANLKILIENDIDITKLLLAIMKSVLRLMQRDAENFRLYSHIPEILVTELNLNSTTSRKLIGCALNNYLAKSKESSEAQSDLDLVIVEEEDCGVNMQTWYSQFLKSIQQKYPSEFDTIIKKKVKTNTKDDSKLSSVLGFAPKVMKKLGEGYLFEMLYHINPTVRTKATQFLVSDYKTHLECDEAFLRESITDRLCDEDPDVVNAALILPFDQLDRLLGREGLFDHLKKIIDKGQSDKEWWTTATSAIKIVCQFDSKNLNHPIVLSIIPYLFPYKDREIETASIILKSCFGMQLFPNANSFVDSTTDCKAFSKIIFQALKDSQCILNSSDLIKVINSCNQVHASTALFSVILLSFCLNDDRTPDESAEIMKDILKFVEKQTLSEFNTKIILSEDTITRFIKESRMSTLPVETLLFLFEKLLSNARLLKNSHSWIDLTNKKPDESFIINAFEVLLDGRFKKFEKFSSAFIKLFMGAKYASPREKIEFIANLVIGYNLQMIKNHINVPLIRSVKILHTLLKMSKDISWSSNSEVIAVSVLSCLHSEEQFVRTMSLEVIDIMLQKCKFESSLEMFWKDLLKHREELQMDNNQIEFILRSLLSGENKKFVKYMFDYITNITLDHFSPFYVKKLLISLISNVNPQKILYSLSPLALKVLENLKSSVATAHEIQTFLSITSCLSTSSIDFKKENPWKLIVETLSSYNLTFVDDDGKVQYIFVLMIQQINQEIFDTFPMDKAQLLINLIINAATFGESPLVISASSKLIKKLELKSPMFISILDDMENIFEKNTEKSLKKKMYSPQLSLLETRDWKLGVTLLERIQDKKKLSGFEELMPLLFKILKRCLEFEEQSAVEYVKQLLLTSILLCCQQLYPTNGDSSNDSLKSTIDIELAILCIRGSQNPQTHHHALMLLSHIAFVLPHRVLHHMMAIFTFIGSSILRQDDAYSFQIIAKIIETVIPILIQADKNKDLDERVIPVLRIFVDAALDIPEHRRFALFKKLLCTLNEMDFLWCFMGLMFESHVVHGPKDDQNEQNRRISDKDQPAQRLEFTMSIALDYPPDVILNACNQLIVHLKNLPEDKPEDDQNHDVIDSTQIFLIPIRTPKQLRHYKYVIVTFFNSLLSSPIFINSVEQFEDKSILEKHYKTFIVNILTYIQNVSRVAELNVGKPQAKYWKVMLHHCYEILDNANNLLSAEMFVLVIRGLTTHNLMTVKRKAMEILNTKLQHQSPFFSTCDKDLLFSLLDPLMDIIKEIDRSESNTEVQNKQEIELNQQTALLSLKLLVKLLCQIDPNKFKQILNVITDLMKSKTLSGNLLASVVLCLAELCSNLKAHAIGSLPKYMPVLVRILKEQTKANAPELVLLSVITAMNKIVETIPLFLSPYLEKILFQLSILSAKWKKMEKTNSPVVMKLSQINNKISSTIAPRVLIPTISQCYVALLTKEKYEAIGSAMNVLADSFTGVSGPEFNSLQQDLTNFFLSALQFRSDHVKQGSITTEQIDQIEQHIINALGALVLKLSESSFRPLYYKIYDWSTRETGENYKYRAITFYKLSSHIAENLRGLFVLFAGHFIKNAADLLNACNKSKNQLLYYDDESDCRSLVECILTTLNAIFTYDSQNFINKDRFETIMQPLVDQLENDICGMESLTARGNALIIPCVAQFAVATADDSLWKPLNYQVLLKTRHNEAVVRLLGLECVREMATKLGDSWLPLLPESVPFLAELLEDDVQIIEASTQKAIQTLESVLGEPLQKYF